MNLDKDFFSSEVEFIDASPGLVETEHPKLAGKSWSVRNTALGLIGGALLTLSSPAFATELRVTPLSVAAAERRQKNDAAKVVAQDLQGFVAASDTLLDDLRHGRQVGGEALRAVTARKFGAEAIGKRCPIGTADGSIRFVVGPQ